MGARGREPRTAAVEGRGRPHRTGTIQLNCDRNKREGDADKTGRPVAWRPGKAGHSRSGKGWKVKQRAVRRWGRGEDGGAGGGWRGGATEDAPPRDGGAGSEGSAVPPDH